MSEGQSRVDEKRKILEELLKGDYAFIHISSRSPGIRLPLSIIQAPVVTLKISYNFEGKMTLNENGVDAVLTFDGKPFNCHVPWNAIWGMSSVEGKRFVWTDELPEAALAEASKNSSPAPSSDTPHSTTQETTPEKPRPTLRRIK